MLDLWGEVHNSYSIIKGTLTKQRFYFKETPKPLFSELPIQSLGWWHKSDQWREETIKGLIDKMSVPGKLEPAVWVAPPSDVASNGP